VSSLLILAAAISEISYGKKQTDRQTDRQTPLKPLPHADISRSGQGIINTKINESHGGQPPCSIP